MRAIDTNIAVRFLTGEDHPQTDIARKVVTEGNVFVSTTVMLETAWVLRSVYGFSRPDVVRALRAFAGLPGVTLEAAEMIAGALDRAAAGMDIADALHLGAATGYDEFLTFDRKFINAVDGGAIIVREPDPA